MPDFSKDIQQFQNNGTYEYKFDSVGNLIFNSSSVDFSQVYLSLPLTNVVYNNDKIGTFYNTEFEEFIPTTASVQPTAIIADLQQQLDMVQEENAGLKTQLDSVISSSSEDASGPNQIAIMQVVLELRKALGQGRVDSDFSSTFPYTPIRKAESST